MQISCKKFVKIDRKSTNNSETKRSLKKIIAMTKTLSNEHVMIDVTLNNKKLQTMLNSSVSENFVAKKYAHYHNLSIRRKTVVYSLMSMNGSAIEGGRVTDEITIMLKIEEHRKKITLDIVDIINHDVILDISWLRKWNSHID